MDNQLVQPKELVQQITLITITIIVIVLIITLGWYFHRISNPYIQEVLSLQGNRVRGSAIFQINCAACHGLQADGSIGPSLHDIPKRKSRIGLIKQVTSGKTPPMPKFQPSHQEMADILSFLETL